MNEEMDEKVDAARKQAEERIAEQSIIIKSQADKIAELESNLASLTNIIETMLDDAGSVLKK
jgi:uncharacterized coiled-coil protein SlyX